MPLGYVPAEKMLTAEGPNGPVSVYYTYKDDMPESGQRTFGFVTRKCDDEEGDTCFDVRDLDVLKQNDELRHAVNDGQSDAIEKAITEAIKSGEITSEEEEEKPEIVEAPPQSFDVQAAMQRFLDSMVWTEDTSNDVRNLVIDNLKGFGIMLRMCQPKLTAPASEFEEKLKKAEEVGYARGLQESLKRFNDRLDDLSERGNVLIVGDDGGFNAWFGLEGGKRMEVSWRPENYPALTLSVVDISDPDLWAHIKKHCGGFHIRKANLEVPECENGWPHTVPELDEAS